MLHVELLTLLRISSSIPRSAVHSTIFCSTKRGTRQRYSRLKSSRSGVLEGQSGLERPPLSQRKPPRTPIYPRWRGCFFFVSAKKHAPALLTVALPGHRSPVVTPIVRDNHELFIGKSKTRGFWGCKILSPDLSVSNLLVTHMMPRDLQGRSQQIDWSQDQSPPTKVQEIDRQI
jgi:hypothetical protein